VNLSTPTSSPAIDVPVSYVLDVLGNVLFLQILRGVVAHIPIWISNAPEISFERIKTFFQRVASEYAPQIHSLERTAHEGALNFWEVHIDYKTRSILRTAFPEKFCQEEETLVQRLRESTTTELTLIQLKNFFTKISKIQEIYAQSPLDVRQDIKKFHAEVQKNFRKVPVSREFVEYIIEIRSVGQSRAI